MNKKITEIIRDRTIGEEDWRVNNSKYWRRLDGYSKIMTIVET